MSRLGVMTVGRQQNRPQYLPAPGAAPLAVHEVGGDTEEIGPELPHFGVAGPTLVETEKGLLGHVLSAVAIAGQAAEVVDQGILVAVDQQRKGIGVTLPGPGEQLAVGQALVWHLLGLSLYLTLGGGESSR